MGNLIAFLRRYFHVLLFVFLQVLAIVMLYHSMNYPRFAIARATQFISGPINNVSYNIIRHFNLSAENDALVDQNIALLRDMPYNFLVSSDSVTTVTRATEDTVTHKTTERRIYDYSTANVVYNTIHRKCNYLMIDKGGEDGVASDMAVLSPLGVVGLVTDVSAHFSLVRPIIHPNTKISAKVLPANQIGSIVWEYGDPSIVTLKDIPEHMNINVGDSVCTSGYSDIFPSGIPIGVICEKSKSSGSSFLSLKVRLSTDFNRINTVYLVRNLYKDEIDELKAKMEEEDD